MDSIHERRFKNTHMNEWDQSEIDRIIEMISDLKEDIRVLQSQMKSAEVDIDVLTRTKKDQ